MPKSYGKASEGEVSMSSRGPQLRTTRNSRPGSGEFIEHHTLAPTCDLTPEARVEFDRLINVLRSKGSLGLVDLGGVTDLARMTDLLSLAIKAGDAKAIGIYQSHVRGLRRELGLTRQPSRSVVRTVPGSDGGTAAASGIAKFIKLS
jgi:hypothetical protein